MTFDQREWVDSNITLTGATTLFKMGYHPQFESFEFEKIDANRHIDWSIKYRWHHFFMAIFYAILVQVGQRYMKDRKPVNLKPVLIIWNFALAIFSGIGFSRILPYFLRHWFTEDGAYRTFCVKDYVPYQVIFWSLLYTYSKYIEYGDTLFLILKKRPVSFLHWFHHMSMSFSTFFLLGELEPNLIHPIVLNYGVHTIMYTYFGIMSMGYKLPKAVSIIMTTVQILQFVHVNFYQIYTLSEYFGQRSCFRTPNSIMVSLALGFIYMTLFMNLFYQNYVVKKQKAKSS